MFVKYFQMQEGTGRFYLVRYVTTRPLVHLFSCLGRIEDRQAARRR